MSEHELNRLSYLIDKRGDYSVNLTANELDDYESLTSKYEDIESGTYKSLHPYLT